MDRVRFCRLLMGWRVSHSWSIPAFYWSLRGGGERDAFPPRCVGCRGFRGRGFGFAGTNCWCRNRELWRSEWTRERRSAPSGNWGGSFGKSVVGQVDGGSVESKSKRIVTGYSVWGEGQPACLVSEIVGSVRDTVISQIYNWIPQCPPLWNTIWCTRSSGSGTAIDSLMDTHTMVWGPSKRSKE